MSNSTKSGTALITGASSGIGAAYARKLAAQGKNLILVARRKERLAALAEGLHRDHAIAAEVLVADLTKPADIEQVEKRIHEIEPLGMLINNAGFGTAGNFSEIDLARQIDILQNGKQLFRISELSRVKNTGRNFTFWESKTAKG